MDRNTVIGLVLIGLILFGYSLYTVSNKPKTPPTITQEQIGTDTVVVKGDTTLATVFDSAGNPLDSNAAAAADSLNNTYYAAQFGQFANVAVGEADTFVLENEEMKLGISSKGGYIQSIELKGYKTYDQKPLYLTLPGDQKFYLDINAQASTADFYFTSTGAKPTADGQEITLTATGTNGASFSHVYRLPAKGFLVDYDFVVNNVGKDVWGQTSVLVFNWQRKARQVEKDHEQENRNSRLYYRDMAEGVDYLSETGTQEEKLSDSYHWVSYTQPFFNTTLIATGETKFDELVVKSDVSKDKTYLKDYSSKMYMPYNGSGSQTYNFQYYIGPNHYQTLKKMDIELEDVINLGSGIMAWVTIFNKYLIIPIFNFLEPIGNYGVIILILTLIIKMILFPLTYRSYISQAKMRLLKPEMDALKEKYKDDQARFAQEQMKLWGKAGASPFSGCLPTLLQMPILVAMYFFFPSSIELRQEKFLWADDLSTYDSIWDFGFNVPLYGDHVSLFTLLMAVTSIIYAVSNARLTGQQEGPLKYMPYIFPIMLLGIFNSFPAALTYYYFLANVISYLQQWVIRKFIVDEDALHKKMQEKKTKPSNPNSLGSRLSKAFEEAQKNAQEQQKRNQSKKK